MGQGEGGCVGLYLAPLQLSFPRYRPYNTYLWGKANYLRISFPKIQPITRKIMKWLQRKEATREKLRKNHWGGRGGEVVWVSSPLSSSTLDPTSEDTTKTFQEQALSWTMQQEGSEGTPGQYWGIYVVAVNFTLVSKVNPNVGSQSYIFLVSAVAGHRLEC